MSQVLIRGVRPALPVPGLGNGPFDVAIDASGRIERVGSIAADEKAGAVIEAEGASISPAWVDLHTHVYWGATDISVPVAAAGMARGVATVVDAGSAGEANIEGFVTYVVQQHPEEVFEFLNVGSIGLVACNRVSELAGVHSIDADRLLDAVAAYPSVIRGLKIRASHVILGDWGITPVRLAKQLSRIAGVPLMVHVGEAPPLLDEVLAVLEEGDVVTHCYHGKRGASIREDEWLFQAMVEAQQRGVCLDVGHGAASFSFRTARWALDRGLVPYTISTDLHRQNVDGPVWDLATTMSKLLNLGMSLGAVIEAVTLHPLAILGREGQAARWLQVGTPARFTLFRMSSADFHVQDSTGALEHLSQFILPEYTIVGTQIVRASSPGFAALSARSAEAR